MDQRLARRLADLLTEEGSVEVTHADLAADLGTAREVVSRLLKEFERRDLGEDIRRSGSGKMLRRSRTTSITLDHDLIEKLRAKGAKRGLGYQTMLKVIVMEHVDEY